MSHRRPIVLGCDPGPNHTAFGIMGDRTILHTSMLVGVRIWDEYCVKFQDTLKFMIETCAVEYLAIEDFVWYGEYAKVEAPIRELIGIARTFSRTIPVRVVPMSEWSTAITGMKPGKTCFQGEVRPSWKKGIRKAMHLRCQEMGINLMSIVGPDPGNHQIDALALGLYVQDVYYIESYGQSIDIKRRVGNASNHAESG